MSRYRNLKVVDNCPKPPAPEKDDDQPEPNPDLDPDDNVDLTPLTKMNQGA